MSSWRPDARRAALAALAWLAAGRAAALAQNDLLWSVEYDSPAHKNDWCEAVAYDPAGNLIGAGWEYRPDLGQGDDIRVFKYDAAGRVLWTRTHDGVLPGNVHDDDDAFGAAVDPSGSVYVCGHVRGGGVTSDAWLQKYDGNGNDVWTVEYDSPAHDQDVFWGVAVSPDGGTVYVVGSENRPDLGQGGNWLVRAYQASDNAVSGLPGGTLAWAQTYNDATFNLWDEALGVAVDAAGNVLVTGYGARFDPGALLASDVWSRRNVLWDATNLGVVDTRLILAKYDPAGNPLWSTSVVSPWTPTSTSVAARYWGRTVLAAPGGDPIVIGSEQLSAHSGGSPGFDRYAFRWAADGSVRRWVRDIGREPGAVSNNDDFGFGGALGTDGVLHLVGATAEFELLIDQAYNLTIDDLDPATGLLGRQVQFNIGLEQSEWGMAGAAGPGGIYAVAGKDQRDDLGEHDNWIVRVYAGPQPVVATPTGGKAWPNPFNPATARGGTMKFGVLVPGSDVRIWTVRGLLVRTLREQGGEARWDGRNDAGKAVASGVYLYQVDVPGAGPVRGRLVLVRE